jgi:2-polyprenyl-3-methyl-5-hydroxy-6-metoxy-1,4-benzoquinol methylase
MRHRPCPFCCNESFSIFGIREDLWIRCKGCHSVFRDITAEKFEQLHGGAFQDTHFVDSHIAVSGLEPRSALWEELALPGTSLLEIGPGTGDLLAAARKAGRSVTAVESSDVHRAFIRKTWDIHSVYPDLAAVPPGLSFDAVVAINVLEHIYDVAKFLRSIAAVLASNGVIFVSTANAVSLEATLLRSWWSMCKEHDHVSFPSPDGMARAAQAADLRTDRVWSTELPFELPISALVAARDWARARRGPSIAVSAGHRAGSPGEHVDTASKARLARLYSVGAHVDPTSRLLGTLGRAATVKARLRLGETARSSS